MSRVTFGAGRGALAVAHLTLIESSRCRWLVLLLVAQVAWTGVRRTDFAIGEERAALRFAAHSLEGLRLILIIGGAAIAASMRTGARSADARRFPGFAAICVSGWYWGRVLGLLGAIVGGSALLVVPLVVHQFARFGSAAGIESPRDWILPIDGSVSRLSATGDVVERTFAVSSPTNSNLIRVEGRLRLALLAKGSGASTRSRYPVVIAIGRSEDASERRVVVDIPLGRPTTFWIEAPARVVRGGRVVVSLRALVDDQVARLSSDGLLLFGAHRSPWSQLLTVALVTAMEAAVIAALVHAAALRLSTATAILAALLLAVSGGLAGFIADGLGQFGSGVPGRAIATAFEIALPNGIGRRVIDDLLLGRAVAMPDLAGLAVRWSVTSLLLGLLVGGIAARKEE